MAIATPVRTTGMSRAELDPIRCGTPGCECGGPLFLSPVCHQGGPVLVSYDWTTGLLTVTCADCERFVASIVVAQTQPQPPTGEAA